MTEQLAATYNHQEYEKKWWNHWLQGGYFHGDVTSPKDRKPPYSIVIPPPNVTDRLHMGHGLNNTIQDILIRWKRMQGYNCSWIPGTDHAGIATQMMVEKSLAAEGTSRQALGREEFFARCVAWKDKNGGIIIEQLKRLGASCDWQRQAYTMDPQLSKAVRQIFVDLYERGLIYRGERLVNWDPVLKTAISDDELENQEVAGQLYYYRYPLADAPEEFVTIATTRPETMFGDTAVAVNPDDERFAHLIGRMLRLPLTDRLIPVIGDSYVKGDYGSGCVKITPAHDVNDFEMGKRHNLPMLNVMREDASMNEQCPAEFVGLDRYVARKLVVQRLKDAGLFDRIETVKHAVPYSDRSKVAIEPRLSLQWYVRMQELAEPAIAAAKQDELRFYPAAWKKTYLHWLENIQDWCISRQLWWGHRIPIWYCQACEAVSTGMDDPSACQKCGSTELRQDEDVLDTWFSSWLWPLSPLGWPEETPDLDYFFPSAVLVTGPDIIYLWVARMVMAGYFTKGKLAFKDVYFNAIICDKQGRKFSKTLGNGIDPLALIERYGADAVRYTCVSLAPLGGRVKMAESDFDNGLRFMNKLWNAARFLMRYAVPGSQIKPLAPAHMDLAGKWLVHELHKATAKINSQLAGYHINEAVESLFHLAWRAFCDWGLESAKETLEGEPSPERDACLSLLVYTFEGILRLASPVIPFICEEIWQKLPAHPNWGERPASLMIAQYPQAEAIPAFAEAGEAWGEVQQVVAAVRSLRSQAGVPPKVELPVTVACEPAFASLLLGQKGLVKRLAKANDLNAGAINTRPPQCLVATGRGWTVYLPVGDYLDFPKEQKRLEGEYKRVQKIVAGLEAKLGNANFMARAPEDIVEANREQLANMQGQLSSLAENLAAIKDA